MTEVHSFELILLLLALCVPLALLAQALRIPPAAAFVVGGMAIAVAPGVPVAEIAPDLILALFLPPLLQSSAFFTVWRDFRANLRPILVLALGAVAFSTAVVGWTLKQLAPELPWAACFAFGAIVSPPDAVSAAAILERLRIPRRLVTVLEGESLVNDASGLVLYRFAVTAALTGTFDPLTACATFAVVALGGIVIGYGIGRSFVWATQWLRDARLQITASFLIGWASYLAAERAGVSGVLSTVTCGLVMGWRRHDGLDAPTRMQSRATWSSATFVLDAMVFILIGSSLHDVLARVSLADVLHILPTAALVSSAVILSRFAWVFPGVYLPRLLSPSLRHREPPPHWSRPVVISWAGMRGVVSLAAALALPEGFPGRDAILFLTFTVILVTVLLQGTTLGPLIRWLRLAPGPADPIAPEWAARAEVTSAMVRLLEQRAEDPLEGAIARDLLAEYRDRAGAVTRWRDQAGAAAEAERAARRSLRLDAIEAGRQVLLELLRSRQVHDSVIDAVEWDLDLEDLRYRSAPPALD